LALPDTTAFLCSIVGAMVRDPTRLLAAMHIINKTQGKNALYFATAHNSLNNAPMRIAFNRIPDIETER
jgi:DNA polymerase IV